MYLVYFFPRTCTQVEFDDPKETEPWYINLRVPVERSNGVYYGPYKTKRSLFENLIKWINAYTDKYETISENCVGREALLAFLTVGQTLEDINGMPSYLKVCYCQKLDTCVTLGSCQGIETCVIVQQGPIAQDKHYGVHFEPPPEKTGPFTKSI